MVYSFGSNLYVDGEEGNGVCVQERGADREGFEEGDLESRDVRPDEENQAEDEGGDKGTGDCSADIAEEVALLQSVSPPSVSSIKTDLM